VGDVRQQLEGRGEIPHVEKARDSRGRKQSIRRTQKARPLAHEATPRGKEEGEEAPEVRTNGEIKVRGVGTVRAQEAINCLSRIPKNDALRERGFQIVMDWIKTRCDESKLKGAANAVRPLEEARATV